ncbi:unnamed protein product, partial [Brenthis ino]
MKNANGGLVKGFIESVHEKAHKVHDDIRDFLHPKNNENVPAYNSNNEDNNDGKLIFVSSPTLPANAEGTTNDNNLNRDVKSENISEDKVVFVVSSTTEVAAATVTGSTTTEKEGRENFFGGCSTGFKRTADGRCKPTF